MSRLSVLLSELDAVDKLAEGHINKLVTNISDWTSSKKSEGICYNPGGDWVWQSSFHFDGLVLIKFLALNKRFTKAMKKLSSYHSTIMDHPDVSRTAKICAESWSRRFRVYRRTRRVFYKLRKKIKERLALSITKDAHHFPHNWLVRDIRADISIVEEQQRAWSFLVVRSVDDILSINHDSRSMLTSCSSAHVHLDPSSAPLREVDLGADKEEAFASDVESPTGHENGATVDQESVSIAAAPGTKTIGTKSPADPPYHFWVMAFLVLVTAIVVTVGIVVTTLANLLSSLLPTLGLLAMVYLLLSQRQPQGEARKAPPTEIDLDISAPESATSTSTSGESIEFSPVSLTTPSFTRPSSKMLEALAMANEFNNDCTETNVHMARDYSDSITLDCLSSMRDELHDISATRDSFEEPRVTIPAVIRGDAVEEDSAVSVDEPDDITTAFESPDVAVNAAESFLKFIRKLFMALDNLATTASRDHTIKLSNYEGNKVVCPSSITGLTNISMAKEGETLWYELLLMMDTNSISGLLGQTASLKPRKEKDYKATRLQTTTSLLHLQMIPMRTFTMDMGCLFVMRMLALLYLFLSASAHGPGNNL